MPSPSSDLMTFNSLEYLLSRTMVQQKKFRHGNFNMIYILQYYQENLQVTNLYEREQVRSVPSSGRGSPSQSFPNWDKRAPELRASCQMNSISASLSTQIWYSPLLAQPALCTSVVKPGNHKVHRKFEDRSVVLFSKLCTVHEYFNNKDSIRKVFLQV